MYNITSTGWWDLSYIFIYKREGENERESEREMGVMVGWLRGREGESERVEERGGVEREKESERAVREREREREVEGAEECDS